MDLDKMSDEARLIAIIGQQFDPDILSLLQDFSFLKDIYQSWEEKGLAGKEEKEFLIKKMEPLAESPEEKEFLKKIRKSLQGG